MPPTARARIRRRRRTSAMITGAVLAALLPAGAACTSARSAPAPDPSAGSSGATSVLSRSSADTAGTAAAAGRTGRGAPGPTTSDTRRYTLAFAGDVHFAGRLAPRLAHDPATVFAQAAAGLRRADLTMVNLETAITRPATWQDPANRQAKEFTFHAPPSALTALRDAGIDVATEANNHGADYGRAGLRDTLAAIRRSGFPVIGIGRDAAAAFAPYRTTLAGQPVAIIAADQVQDETTLRLFSAGPHRAGVANAYESRLEAAVRSARRSGAAVIVYVHWGIEYDTCPSADQRSLATRLARAGATAVIGTHAHVLQGAGWLPNGTYVAYGLGNYLWWMSFGNLQDDNGVLTLHLDRARVTGAQFAPSHLDARGVPVPATGAERRRILAEWRGDRACTGLRATPPG